MDASLQVAPRCKLRARALSLLLPWVFFISAEARASSSLRSSPSPPLLASTQLAGQAADAPSPALEDQIHEALAQGKSDVARKLLPMFLGEPNVLAEALLRTGADLAQHEMFEEAGEVFARCVANNPGLFEAYYNLALAQLASRKYSEALATIAKAPHSSPDYEVARTYLRGKIELALRQNAEAERDLGAAFAAAPQIENYALDLGLAYLISRKYQQAIDVFKKGVSYQGGSPFLLLGLGLAQFLGGQSAESIETCHSLLSLQPDFSPVRVLLAFDLIMEGDASQASQVAAQGLQDANPFPYLYYIHAAALLKEQSKDYAGILKDLAQAERGIPGCALCYLSSSKAHQKMGERDAATADLEQAIKLDPTLAEAWYRLASLYDEQGRHTEAQQARRHFGELKENKANRDTEMLRDAFLKSLGLAGSP